MCIYTQVKAYEVLHNNNKYLIFGTHISHIYGHLSVLCLANTFVFTNAQRVLSNIHKHFTFGSHMCSFISMITYVFLIWHTDLLFPYYYQ